jgi:hypothetical protein
MNPRDSVKCLECKKELKMKKGIVGEAWFRAEMVKKSSGGYYLDGKGFICNECQAKRK